MTMRQCCDTSVTYLVEGEDDEDDKKEVEGVRPLGRPGAGRPPHRSHEH